MPLLELTNRRMSVLHALATLPNGEIQDPDGQATALLMVDTGHRTTNALSGVMMQLEHAGLIEREVSGGRRTYRIALTQKGWDAVRSAATHVQTTPGPVAEPRCDCDALRAKVERLEKVIDRLLAAR